MQPITKGLNRALIISAVLRLGRRVWRLRFPGVRFSRVIIANEKWIVTQETSLGLAIIIDILLHRRIPHIDLSPFTAVRSQDFSAGHLHPSIIVIAVLLNKPGRDVGVLVVVDASPIMPADAMLLHPDVSGSGFILNIG